MTKKKPLLPRAESRWTFLQRRRKHLQQKLADVNYSPSLEMHRELVKELRDVKRELNKLAAEGHGA
jgi:hypothetical protein